MIMSKRAGMRALPAAGWVSRRLGLGDSGSHVPPMDVPDNAGLRYQSRIGCFLGRRPGPTSQPAPDQQRTRR
jgi:hypothetical protein